MKYAVIVADGMADRPLKELNGRTPLEAAEKPGMDYIAKNGRMGLLETIPSNMPAGSDIANMCILGYDPKRYYPGGRGPLEAASLGVILEQSDLAFRCNLITEEKGVLKDYSGGHITTEEAWILIEHVDRILGSGDIRFYPGVSYRHVMVLRDAGIAPEDIKAMPPHDIVGQRVKLNLIKPEKKDRRTLWVVDTLNEIMLNSKKALEGHSINIKRLEKGKNPANMVWLWGGGRKPNLPSFRDKYKMSGALISAVDLLRGLGIYIGLEVLSVPGATGYLDTDYAAKGEHALAALDKHDYVYVHIEAPDEAGHIGDAREKIKAIEEIDRNIITPLLDEYRGKDLTIAVLPDHATPVEVRTHTTEPVPFAIYSPSMEGDNLPMYSETSASKGSYGLKPGICFMDLLLGSK